MNPTPSVPPGPLAPEVVLGYLDATLPEVEAIRVDELLVGDPAARRQVNAATVAQLDPVRLDLTWCGILVGVDPPRRGWFERAAAALGLPVDVARLMAATPSMRRSWYLTIAGALLFGLAAASPSRQGTGSELLFLILAPLVPVVGVALAYGPGVDPAHEVTVAAPLSGLRLVLTRVAAVLAVSIVLGGAASLLLRRGDGAHAAAWLLPSFGLSMACLALTTFVRPKVAGSVVGGAWIAVAVLCSGQADQFAVVGPPTQVAMLGIGFVGLLVTVARRGRFDEVRVP